MSCHASFVVRMALGLGVLLGGALVGSSDPEEARRALETGRAALGRKDWTAAATQYQRALDEDGALLEAWLGLGEAHAGGGDRAKASQSFRSLLGAIEELPEPSEEQRALYTKTRKRTLQLGRDDATLDGLVRKHADALAALSVKWATKDPAAAAEAARAALRIAPDHAKAADLQARATQGPSGKTVAIFNGRDGVGFEPLTKEWTVQDGLLIGEVRQDAYLLSSQQRWAGD
jgi:tetratricopeptide (TPR) repeat protein